MAAFNHHPYLASVLDSLQRHQSHIDAQHQTYFHSQQQQASKSSTADSNSNNNTNDTSTLFIELPWQNNKKAWRELEEQQHQQAQHDHSAAFVVSPPHQPHFHDIDASGDDAAADIDSADEWEDDTPQMKLALRLAGVDNEQQEARQQQPTAMQTALRNDHPDAVSTTTTGGKGSAPIPRSAQKKARDSCTIFPF